MRLHYLEQRTCSTIIEDVPPLISAARVCRCRVVLNISRVVKFEVQSVSCLDRINLMEVFTLKVNNDVVLKRKYLIQSVNQFHLQTTIVAMMQ